MHEPERPLLKSRSARVRECWAARAAMGLIAIALLSFLAGCGLFRRERLRETPTVPAVPAITQTVPPATQAPPLTSTPVAQTQTVAPAGPTGRPSPLATPPPVTAGIALGVYEPAADPFSQGTAIDRYTKKVGKKPAYAWFSVKWRSVNTGAYQQFDARLLDQYRTRGIMPGLNWDASKGSALNKDQPDFSWKAIISGKHDVYLQQVAAAVAAYRYPFLVRVLEEMNGNWYPWAYSVNGNANPVDFVTAWKHIVDIFRKAGATNVQFVYNQVALPADLINSNRDKLRQIYPGDEYVDWIALNGYTNARNQWRSLEEIFQPSYDLLTSLSARPMIFYEVGAAEKPDDPMFKANWITQGFLTTIPQKFPRVKAAGWFDSVADTKIDNYAVDTSQSSLDAWKQVVASPLYQGSIP